MASSRSRIVLFDDESPYVDRFGLLLVVTVVAVVTLALIDFRGVGGHLRSDIGAVVLTIFVGATFLLALASSGVTRRWRLVAAVIFLVGFAAVCILVVVDIIAGESLVTSRSTHPSVFWVLLSIVAPVAVLRRLSKHRQASVATLFGAVSAFLLIAVAATFAFQMVSAFQTTPFFGAEQPTTSFMYFSLVTITTLGYGDLAPATDLGRLLATSEALLGQVYLVTVVAMVVGLLIQNRMDRE